ncbi:MAG: polysaccharide biosynthesis tyrosine autokinase [Acidobacteria bacterium]|nr:polysaccharide biosynthesis tyrosine autokinase [Acidobacteriota bacterium]
MSEEIEHRKQEVPEGMIERYEPAQHALARPEAPVPVTYETVETEETPELLAYWAVIRKRRWTIMTLLLVVFTLVLIWTLKQKPVYAAKVLLEIEKENPNIATVQELFELDTVSDTYLETQYRILGSESLARRVINQLRLDKLNEFNPPKPWWSIGEKQTEAAAPAVALRASEPEQDPATYQEVLGRFQDRLSVEPVKYSRLVAVRFESENPEIAAQATNTLAANYIEQNLEARWEASQKASEWLAQQLTGFKAKLEQSEEELQGYAQGQGLLFLQNQQGNTENIVNERLRQLQEQMTQAEADRYQKEALYGLLERGNYASLPGILDSSVMQTLTVQLAELQREHAQLTTTFTSRYPRVEQLQNQIERVQTSLDQEREKAADRIRKEYEAAKQREEYLRAAFRVQEQQANLIAEKSVQYSILLREVQTNKQLYEGLLQRLKEAGISAGLKASNIRIVDSARAPHEPIKPKVLLNLMVGFVLGLSLGIGAAFLQEYLDNTVKTPDDVERFLRIPALALIPSVESLTARRGRLYGYGLYGRHHRQLESGTEETSTSGKEIAEMGKRPGWYRIDELDAKRSTLAEAFRSLRTSVLLSTAERPPRVLLVTSAQPGEGKTTITLNLAISLSQLGGRVLLIDADMRRPCMHKVFKLFDVTGLASYLTGQEEWRAAIQQTGVPNLDLMACGPIPPNPAELLSSERMRTFIQEAAGEYGFIVIDSPPILHVTDARILARLAEGTVLVVKGASTPREVARRAQLHCRDVGANVVGVILNNLDVRTGDYYYYYYRYYRYGYGYGYVYGYGADRKDAPPPAT